MDASYLSDLLLALAVALAAAKIAGHLARRLGQAHVLGELVAGIILGNLSLAGIHSIDVWKTDPAMEVFAQLGVILLVFQVGVESTVREMMRVGGTALLVGALGVAGSFALGWGVAAWLLPASGIYAHVFIGAALSATSIGITARVLKDLGRSRTEEARIILGAAVIDDVLGLVILAVVTGAVGAANGGAAMSAWAATWIVVKASGFLFGALAIGVALAPRVFAFAARLDASGALLAAALSTCFLLAWLADAIGLAPIVGAFAAGLVLEETHAREFVERGERNLDDLLEELTSFLGPIFFVAAGARTDLAAFAHTEVLGLAAALTVAAILGKQLSGLGAIGRGRDWLTVGIGMIPRGEVGLIFANIGLTLTLGGQPVIDRGVFTAIVMMVIVTTLITPSALSFSFNRRGRPAPR